MHRQSPFPLTDAKDTDPTIGMRLFMARDPLRGFHNKKYVYHCYFDVESFFWIAAYVSFACLCRMGEAGEQASGEREG